MIKKVYHRLNREKNHLVHLITFKQIFKTIASQNIAIGTDKKVISYSLYGNDDLYLKGALRNIELANKFYPTWKLRFYITKDLKNWIKNELSDTGAEVITMNGTGIDHRFMTWRFLPAADPNVSVMLSRDCDSVFTLREVSAVEEWLNSDKDFHIIRDHPQHFTRILGGMWGVRNGLLLNMKEMLRSYKSHHLHKGFDQFFLTDMIYPLIKSNALIHDSESFFDDEISFKINFTRTGKEFIGEPRFELRD